MENKGIYKSDIELLTGIYTELKEIKSKLADSSKPATNDFGFIDNSELIRVLNISKKTAALWRRNGTLHFTKIGGMFYYKLSDIKDMLQEKFNKNNRQQTSL